MLFDPNRIQNYPDQPGVYVMKDTRGLVLYIGKAKRLRHRLSQYFAPGSSDTRVQIPYLLPKVADIETIVTTSEKEALVLESTLIKRFKPRYNILLKDDRSSPLIRIDLSHPFPRIEVVWSREATSSPGKLYGPYEGRHAAQELFDQIVRIFLLRQCTDDQFRRRVTPCLLYQMRRCSAPCVGKISREEYKERVKDACDVLSGKTKEVCATLKTQIEEASASLDFERAERLHRAQKLLHQCGRISTKKSTPTDTDVIGIAVEKDALALAILHYREGSLVYGESWAFSETNPSSEIFEQLVVQYYLHRVALDGVPKEILFPKGEWSLDSIEELIHDHLGASVRCISPEEGTRASLVSLAIDNARARLSQRPEFQTTSISVLEGLQHILSLKRLPRTIDCFDASHCGGTDLVAASVGFVDGKKDTARYRKFHIRSVSTGDDPKMLQEAIQRRYASDDDLPDLILIDGGRTQLRAAETALNKLSFCDVDLVAIAKDQSRHDKGLRPEILYTKNQDPIALPPTSRELLLLQSIRDEAHRYVIGFQRKHRESKVVTSQLDTIPGIGPKRRQALLRAFPSIDAIKKASIQELSTILPLKQAQAVYTALKQ